jgi:hypothetical protein
MIETSSDELVRLIAERCFGGRLPHYPDEIVAAVVKCMPCVRDASEAETQQFVNLLLLAICERIIAQTATDKAGFAN